MALAPSTDVLTPSNVTVLPPSASPKVTVVVSLGALAEVHCSGLATTGGWLVLPVMARLKLSVTLRLPSLAVTSKVSALSPQPVGGLPVKVRLPSSKVSQLEATSAPPVAEAPMAYGVVTATPASWVTITV